MSVEAMSWAFQLEGLSVSQKITLLALGDHASKDEWACWPSIETLKKKTALSERHVRRTLRQLEGLGLLTMHTRFKEGRQVTSIYKIKVGGHPVLPTPDTMSPSGLTPCPPEPSIPNHQVEPSVPGMPAAPTAQENPVLVSDIIKKQKAKVDASKALSPKALAAAYHAMAATPKSKGLTAAVLGQLWREAHGAYVDAFLPALTVKEQGMLSAAKTRVGPIIVDALTHAMADWPAFLARAKESGGAYKTPATPRVWFFVKYVEDAIAMLQATEKTAVLTGKPVQVIAPKDNGLTNAKPDVTLGASKLTASDMEAVLNEVEGTDG